MKIILASKSGVRKQILDKYKIDNEVMVSNVDEDEIKDSLLAEGADPLIISKNLAEIKSIKVSNKNPDRLVLGADSVVSLNNELINKPKSREEAFSILKKLNNSIHNLISSVCISKNGAMIWNHTDSSELKMKKKFGIVGNPIKHSLSPVLHKYWFDKYDLDASYSIIEAKDEDLKDIAKKIRNHELTGINVTLPFKQKIINQTDKIVNDAELTGSVNTVLLDNDKIIGENTDVFGLQAAYLKEIDNSIHKSALIIGAGGVSPSVILSLQKSGIKEMTVTNRTNEKCIFLKKRFSYLNITPWEDLKDEIKKFDIIINATSLGLRNGEDFNFNFLSTKENIIYIDTIYNPLETKTYKFLKEEGRKVFNGLDMFIYQGQKSFYLWNKINPEIDNELIELLNSKLK